MGSERVIKICVNGLTMKLSIPEEREEIYRRAAKLLNERIDVYNRKFSLPYTDILTMVAYEMAVNETDLEAGYRNEPLAVLGDLAAQINQALEHDGDD